MTNHNTETARPVEPDYAHQTTPYTDAAPAVRDAGRRAARHKLDGLIPDHLAEQVANEIADAVLEAVLPQIAAARVAVPGAEGYGEPVHWTVYNAMHQRALYAEYRAAANPATGSAV